MFGYLLACDPGEQSASDIAAGIGMSRASVSSAAKLLQSMNALEEREAAGTAAGEAVGERVASVLTVSKLPVDIRHNAKIGRSALAMWAAPRMRP